MPLTEVSPEARFEETLLYNDVDWVSWSDAPQCLGVAVSGGGDSMALLHIAATWCSRLGHQLQAVTVDHGLRTESAAEAAFVARACQELGVPHETLRWGKWDGQGNLQDAARRARRRLISAWAERVGTQHVCLGHTADDQAETVLLRLARGSGVDGLAGMERVVVGPGIVWYRPLLEVTREVLRGWLRARTIPWIEDPSNDDLRFDRVRTRAMMGHLAGLGLTRERLVRTAQHMARARTSLARAAAELAAREAREDGADLLVLKHLFFDAPIQEEAGRVLAAAVMWVGGREHRPRYEALVRFAGLVATGRTATLGGCRTVPEGDWVRIAAETRTLAARRERTGDFAGFVGRGSPD